jgi:hypothetical protein
MPSQNAKRVYLLERRDGRKTVKEKPRGSLLEVIGNSIMGYDGIGTAH